MVVDCCMTGPKQLPREKAGAVGLGLSLHSVVDTPENRVSMTGGWWLVYGRERGQIRVYSLFFKFWNSVAELSKATIRGWVRSGNRRIAGGGGDR